MKHLLPRLLSIMLGLLVLLPLQAHAADDFPEFIYIIGHDNKWTEPCVENADRFEVNKLRQIVPGIYSGSFYFSDDSYFKFYTRLLPKDQNGNSHWKSFVVYSDKDGQQPKTIGRSGVISTTVNYSERLSAYEEAPTWHITKGMTYKVTLDLNSRRMSMKPNILTVGINTTNYADLIAIDQLKDYVP